MTLHSIFSLTQCTSDALNKTDLPFVKYILKSQNPLVKKSKSYKEDPDVYNDVESNVYYFVCFLK